MQATDRPYLHGVRFLARLSPIGAYRDLRAFLSYRERHELWFAALAVVLTMLLIGGFVYDSRIERPPEPRRRLTYVESWPLSRTDREIIEQQKRDVVARDKREAELRAANLERRRQLKALDDKLESWGF